MPSAPLTLAAPSVPDPMEAPAIRWGVLAPGGIANTFADAVHEGTRSRVVAVGSRSLERAREFAGRHGVERAHGSYADLVADPDVDAVYVASPHSEHHEHALLALRAGKPVLVEKAFTRSLREADEVLETAQAAGLLVAEAMWSRYLPHYDVIRRTVEAGTLGEVVLVDADHGQLLWPNGPARLSQPELAGGALLDLGVYPLSFADHVLGRARGRRRPRHPHRPRRRRHHHDPGARARRAASPTCGARWPPRPRARHASSARGPASRCRAGSTTCRARCGSSRRTGACSTSSCRQ